MDFGKMQITNLAQYFATQWTRTPKKSVGRLCLSDLVRSTGRFLIGKPQIRIVRTRFLSHRDNSSFHSVRNTQIHKYYFTTTEILNHYSRCWLLVYKLLYLLTLSCLGTRGWCPCSLLPHIGKFTIPSSQLPGEVGVHKEEKSFWLWVLGSFKGAKRGQRGQKWAKGGQKVEKVLDGQLGSCVRGLPDRSDSRQMSTTMSRKEKNSIRD